MTPNVDRLAETLTMGFLGRYPEEVARHLESAETADILDLAERATEADTRRLFEHLTGDVAAHVLADMSAGRSHALLTGLDPARGAAIVARLEATRQQALLARLPDALATEIRELMTYPPDTAGSLMDVHVPMFGPGATTGETLARLRAAHRPRGSDVVLVDPDGRLVGTVAVEDIALAVPETPLAELVRRRPAHIQVLAPREDIVEQLTELKLASLPVVDAEDRVLGVIRHGALVRAAEEEASADIQTMVGASAAERALSPVGFAVRKRLPWLELNLATAFLAASVVGLFEDTIARFTALAVLLPVVAGQSGNTGAQALAVTMRGLVLREIRLRHWRRVSAKEAIVALINGVGVAATTAIAVYAWSRSGGLAIIIGLSMVLSMIAAGLAGAAVPLLLVAARQDPAQASSIILTTVTDVVGFFSFLGIATLLAGML